MGDVPNTKSVRARELKAEAGRKTVLVPSGKWCEVYVSRKFYPERCKTLHPYHGTGTLPLTGH